MIRNEYFSFIGKINVWKLYTFLEAAHFKKYKKNSTSEKAWKPFHEHTSDKKITKFDLVEQNRCHFVIQRIELAISSLKKCKHPKLVLTSAIFKNLSPIAYQGRPRPSDQALLLYSFSADIITISIQIQFSHLTESVIF